jgi:hypothetical protein
MLETHEAVGEKEGKEVIRLTGDGGEAAVAHRFCSSGS